MITWLKEQLKTAQQNPAGSKHWQAGYEYALTEAIKHAEETPTGGRPDFFKPETELRTPTFEEVGGETPEWWEENKARIIADSHFRIIDQTTASHEHWNPDLDDYRKQVQEPNIRLVFAPEDEHGDFIAIAYFNKEKQTWLMTYCGSWIGEYADWDLALANLSVAHYG